MSAFAGLTSIGNKAANLISFISFILWSLLLSWMITFQAMFTFFRPVYQLLSYLLLNSWRSLYNHCSSKANGDRPDVATSSRPHPTREVCGNVVTREDVELVMEKLGLHQGPLEDTLEIATVFDRKEPSLDEVGEAFGLFDENSDGFIDAGELQKVMNSIGLTGFSRQDCQKMIMAFDENGDGRIDFGEFVKLMEDCFG